MSHVKNNSGNNEWYSPPYLIESARIVMGRIDTDPATSEIANRRVGAWNYYTEQTDGRDKAWCGNVWMNPPYAQPLIYDFCREVSERYTRREIHQAVVLTNNGTDTKWFHEMMKHASCICLLSGRVRFISPSGEKGKAPLQGQVITYFGVRVEEFVTEFAKFGCCLRVARC